MTGRTSFCEHVELGVDDVDTALPFYGETVGLVEIARQDGTVYLGCGQDSNFDLAVVGGGAGIRHFALRARDRDHLAEVHGRLKAAGVDAERRSDQEPGVSEALLFVMPSGHRMELVVVDPATAPLLSTAADDRGFQPLDLDHVNIKVADVRPGTEFLCGVVGLALSDVGTSGDTWVRSWCRLERHHHDVGLGRRVDDQETLSHVAFTMAGIEHMKVALDTLSAAGYRVEVGPGRHRIGENLFVYFREPGGNRFELSAEIALVEPGTPAGYSGDLDDTFDMWGIDTDKRLPASFRRGS